MNGTGSIPAAPLSTSFFFSKTILSNSPSSRSSLPDTADTHPSDSSPSPSSCFRSMAISPASTAACFSISSIPGEESVVSSIRLCPSSTCLPRKDSLLSLASSSVLTLRSRASNWAACWISCEVSSLNSATLSAALYSFNASSVESSSDATSAILSSRN